ncbi:glycosyltransferase [Photobacterium swingsii]|uniref:glycosyltransferase n=1 Tax=Photobacterium swingsii TaxID=680026 RepID=UPI0040675C5B
MTKPHIEVIMAAYNNIQDMKLVLDGYLQQTVSNFSLCIADDGSRPAVKALVDIYKELGLNIRHLWHEDKGYRRAKIINKAISSSNAEFIILTDNDCIPSRYFMADYMLELEHDKVIIGRRVDLYLPVSNALRQNKLSLKELENPIWLIYQSFIKGLKRPEMGIRVPSFIYKQWNKKTREAIGANMAVSRTALLKVNGFDNDFQGYGFEETDLMWRLHKSGLTSKCVLGRCALYHLYHPVKQESNESLQLIESKKNAGIVYCKNGINQ